MRAWVEDLPPVGNCTLGAEEAYHLIKVKRIRVDERIELIDGRGGRASGFVKEIGKKTLTLQLIETQKDPPDPPLGLALALPVQNSTLSSVVPALVQVGMTHLYVFESEYSGRLNKANKAISRLEPVMQQALKQCGRSWLPQLKTFKLKQLMDHLLEPSENESFEVGHVFHPGGEAWIDIRKCLRRESRVLTFIGPEGGFSQNDLSALEAWNIRRIDMGVSILKLETAATCSIFRLRQELDGLR